MQFKLLFKPKYHALCVLSGNFSCILWQKLLLANNLDYLLLAEANSLYPDNYDIKIDYITEQWERRLGAIWIDDIRLIDNLAI